MFAPVAAMARLGPSLPTNRLAETRCDRRQKLLTLLKYSDAN